MEVEEKGELHLEVLLKGQAWQWHASLSPEPVSGSYLLWCQKTGQHGLNHVHWHKVSHFRDGIAFCLPLEKVKQVLVTAYKTQSSEITY